MEKIDLLAEINAACGAVRQHHIDRLPALGIANAGVATIGRYQVPFGVARVVLRSDGLFSPDSSAPPAMIMPVMEGGGLVDLVAFNTSSPARWHWRKGQGWAMGLDMLSPRWDDGPISVYATPLEWLANSGDGLCILDWAAPDIEIERLRIADGFVGINVDAGTKAPQTFLPSPPSTNNRNNGGAQCRRVT